MATTTPNFGWSVPTSTDLVKDGATAIETLGDSIDASFVDLKGGTTGQVLAKASNTDLDYSWVTTDDANAIQNAIVDAKGDLIAASAADTPARLAVGNNGETLVADSSTSTGLRWQGDYAAGKNKIINGDFGIWQRGTSLTDPAGGVYLADRWRTNYAGLAPTARTYSQQSFTAGTAPVAGYEGTFFARMLVTTKGTNVRSGFGQPIENVRTFAGQVMTISFYAKSDSNRTGAVQIQQNFGSGGSATVEQESSISLTSSWQRFTQTFTVGSMTGKTIGTNNALIINIFCNSADGATLDLWGVQVEAGSVATAFQTATGTIQGELAACQRYYNAPSLTPSALMIYSGSSSGGFSANAYSNYSFPVEMRTTPTVTFYAHDASAGQVTLYVSSTAIKSTSVAGIGLQPWGWTGNFSGSTWSTNADSGLLAFGYKAEAEL